MSFNPKDDLFEIDETALAELGLKFVVQKPCPEVQRAIQMRIVPQSWMPKNRAMLTDGTLDGTIVIHNIDDAP